ncbi:MAG TPA: hypothetical protein PK781_06455, partial [Terrimesophilobacter sp.]|nr:hypothetical protein [Terrimesophilobacter sp.]
MMHHDQVRPRIALPAALAGAPFTIREGQDAGLTMSRLRGADLHASFRGVRTLGPPNAVEELARAFQKRAADDTFFCSVTAATLTGIPLPWRLEQALELHVGVPSPARSPRAVGVTGHKYLIEARDLRSWRGLRVTTPERTWCDLATVLSVRDLVAAGDYLIHWDHPITTPTLLEKSLLRHRGRRGRSKCFRALRLLNDRSESRQES